MKEEAIFCSNLMLELGFDKSFGSVPLFIGNTSGLHIAGSRTYSPRAKDIALRYYFFVQELVEGKVGIHYVKSTDQLVDLAPNTIESTVTAISSSSSTSLRLKTPTSSSTTKGRSLSFCARNTCVLLTTFSVLRSYLQRCTYTALLFLGRYLAVVTSWRIFINLFVIDCESWAVKLVRNELSYSLMRC